MQTTDTTDRWTEIRDIHQQFHFHYQLMGGAVLVLLGILLGAAIFAQDEGYATNLYTEILSIIVTVFILNLLSERREEQRRISDLQAQLVRDARSQSNEAAKRAVDELRDRGWLTGEDGLLKGEKLTNANLQEANLEYANLEETELVNAYLQGAKLEGVRLQKANLFNAKLQGIDTDLKFANLEGANLAFADLHYAFLGLANLQGVNLEVANLQEARLWDANLKGAKLREANLQDARLEDASFDQNTILPDGTHWTPGTDLTHFTDPNHPHFWRSDNPVSPAYWGRDQ